MTFYEKLAQKATHVQAHESSTSYFSEPDATLDPFLFDGDHMRASVRNALLSLFHSFWRSRWSNHESWSTVWIAGSGASYQWSASRDPGDLDVLVGVDFLGCRKANPEVAGLSDAEIASEMNREFREHLAPRTATWHGYEVTWYVNEGGYDIRNLNPYAAYNVSEDEWTVRPDPHPHPGSSPLADEDTARAESILGRYNKALDDVDMVINPGLRLNAEITLRAAATEAVGLFDEIHEGRHAAFEGDGLGYADPANARWQQGKASGAIQALKSIKEHVTSAQEDDEVQTYGVHIMNAHDALVRSALNYRSPS